MLGSLPTALKECAQLVDVTRMSKTTLARILLVGMSWVAAVGGAGCRPEAPSEDKKVETVREAVFVNGDLESDAIGVVPTGWTVTTNLNPTITNTLPSPQTLASLNLTSGGYAATKVVGGATESQADPGLGTGASFRYPKYGTRAAVVNYGGTSLPGSSQNVNTMTQTMTTTNADVDSSDNKVHVRFAVAPVLQSGGHPYEQQPYYYVALQNITRGTTLYTDFNASAQAGVPWKIVGSVYYTDWQLVDIAPGNAALAVGDQVKLTVIAAGCSQGGHYGRAYVDGIGSTIPGLYTWATGPTSANAGADITYVVNYRNGGTGSSGGTTLSVVLPTNTTFKSDTLPSACTAPSVGSAGTVTCSLGTLAPGASGSFELTVTIGAGTASGTTITNGNYYIQATGVTALLGPKVQTAVTSGVTYADVSVTKTDGVAAVGWGQAISYNIVVSNDGPGAASSVTVADTMPAQLSGATWTCVGASGGTCTASGSGNVNTTAVLPVGASVTYTVAANVIAGTGTGTVINTATATVGGGASDPDTSNNTAVDTDSIGVLRTLSLTKVNGNGGSIISVPASISCGTSCTSSSGAFVDGTAVVLTASPVSGASFTGWSGACTGSSPTCSLTITADTSVTATFTPPPTVNIITGNNQGAAVSGAFGTALGVRVLDSSGTPISGATVVFTLPSSGASAALSSASATTNSLGEAAITATANATAGAYSIIAGLSGTPTTATFSLWNYGATASISVVSGSGQSKTVAGAFASPLVAIVRDAASQPVPGATVTFAAPGSGASATLGASTATTSASGQASVSATANLVAGTYSVSASVSGVATAASFTLTNTAGTPASIAASAGTPQSTTVGSAFATALLVTVTDSFGSAVPGATVTFAAPGAGASAALSATTATTNASGQASITATANMVAGAYAVTASVTGVSSPASFSLTNVAGAATSIAATGGGGQTTVASTAFGTALSVMVVDSYGNPVSGATVTFTVPSSGASSTLSTSTATTNASGVATVNATANATAGSYTITAAVSGASSPASFSMTNQAALAISPATTTVPPNATVTFVASGGSGTGYMFTLVTNGSNGSIGATTGVYQAGSVPASSDVVRVTDSQGHTAMASVTVGNGVSIDPPSSSVAPQGAVTFTVTGGSGTGYAYTLTTNASGASVDASGHYRAGTTGNVVDAVRVVDDLGNAATASVQVTAALSLAGSATMVAPRGSLTFSSSGGSATGLVYAFATNASGATINAQTGAYTAGATPSVTDVVSVTDSLGNVSTATVQVGVGVSMTPTSPVIAPKATVNFVASGGSGTGYAYQISTNASSGQINATTGVYVAGATGGSVDIVTVTDSLGNTAVVSVSVGDGLSLSPPSSNVFPGQALGFTAHGGSGTGYQYALTDNRSMGQINATTGAYTAGGTGEVTDTVRVTDSLGNQGQATVHVGKQLSLAPATWETAPLGTKTFTVAGGSGTGIAFSFVTNASGGTIDPATGAYQAGPAGDVADVVRATDSLGNTATASVSITARLTATPTAYALPPLANQQLIVVGGAGGNTFAIVVNGSGSVVNASTGAYQAGTKGETTDVVRASDRNGAETFIAISVGPEVSITPDAIGLAPRGHIVFSAAGGSETGFTFALTVDESGASLDPDTGDYTAGSRSNSEDEVTVTDSLGNIAKAQIIVGGGLVVSPNDTMVAPRESLTLVPSGGSGMGYTFVLVDDQSGAKLDPTTGEYQAGATPHVTDVVSVTDSLGNTTTVSIAIGDGLAISPPIAAVSPRGTLSFTARGGSGHGIQFTLSTNASGGDIDAGTGEYTAGAKANVDDQVTATDDLGNTATAAVHVGAGLLLNPPTASISPNGAVSFTASGGGGGYTFVIRSNGSGGSISSTSGKYTAGARAQTHDIVEVTDQLGNSARADVTVGGPLSLSPNSAQATTGQSISFVAMGGSGTGYTYTLSMNGSGGSIDPTTGKYTAGTTNDTVDAVTVTDSLGNQVVVNIAVGAGLAINPAQPTVVPNASLTFTAAGGSKAGYVFSLMSNASGGTIDMTTGAYKAGAKPNVVDVVVVTDSEGATATASVKVGPGLTITPATSSVAPATPVRFTVSGGSGNGIAFVFTTNASTASIDAVKGDYVAGLKGDVTDSVQVSDSLGNRASAMVSVGHALSVSSSGSTVPPRATMQLLVSGGARDYAFSIVTSGSGATVTQTGGQYTAGKIPNTTDVIAVKDANRIVVMVTIKVGPGVSITPAAPVVASGSALQFVATGGSAQGFKWKLSDNRSGGVIDVSTGAYVAGNVLGAGVNDVVDVVDSLGNTASVTIHVDRAIHTSIGGGSGCDCGVVSASGFGGGLGAMVVGLALAIRRRRRE